MKKVAVDAKVVEVNTPEKQKILDDLDRQMQELMDKMEILEPGWKARMAATPVPTPTPVPISKEEEAKLDAEAKRLEGPARCPQAQGLKKIKHIFPVLFFIKFK